MKNMMRVLLGLVALFPFLMAGSCGGEEAKNRIVLTPSGYFDLHEGEAVQPIDDTVEARYARIFNSKYELIQCPLYRRIVTAEGKEFFLGMVLDTALRRALTIPPMREEGHIDTLATDARSFAWYRYRREDLQATACIYIHAGRVPYIVGTTDLDGSSTFALDSIRSRFTEK